MEDAWLAWCPEMLKWMGLIMLEEAAVKMFFHSWCVECLIDGSKIDSIIIESKGGRHAVKAKVLVDCTGDDVQKDAPLIAPIEDAVRTSELLHAIWNSHNLEIRVPVHHL